MKCCRRDDVRARFPVLNPEPQMVGVWEPRAGVLSPEACVSAQLEQARRCGASLRFDEAVGRWQADGERIEVVTGQGCYRARQLIVSAGAWASALLPQMRLPFRVERQVLHWFAPERDADAFQPECCPIPLRAPARRPSAPVCRRCRVVK